ncbi:MAG: hypothetical protein Q9182_007119 [Xanthomendoza sp. 2 TL-2023]
MSSSSAPHTFATPSGWSTPAEPSSTPPSTSPPQDETCPTPQQAHTVINNVVALKACLDSMVRAMTVPPKLYSQPHLYPPTNTLYSPTKFGSQSSFEIPLAPAPLSSIPQSTPELYFDAEGISLSRSGELSILILHIETLTLTHTDLLHVHVLSRRTFTTRTTNNLHTLKSLLEDNRLPKVLFDCRMDSDALFGQYGVLLGGVIDLQLMSLAAQEGGGRHLPGLEHCLRTDLKLTMEEQEWVLQAKHKGQVLWRPKMGGSMERFNDNPLH